MAGLLGNRLGCPPPSAHRWPSSRSSFWTEKRGPRTCWRRSPSLTGHIRSSPRRRWPQAPLLPTARPGLCPWAAHLERGLGPWRKLEGQGLAARLEATPLELCHQAGGGWSIPRLTRARKAKAPGQGEGLVPRVDREGGGPAQDWTPDPPPGLPVHLLRAGPASRGERHHGQDTPEEPPGDVAPVAQAEGGEAPAPPIPHPPAPTTA